MKNTERDLKVKLAVDSYNSFLVETSFNSDIDLDIRRDIEYRFHRSKANSQYKFPRIVQRKNNSKHANTKSSENLNKMLAPHKYSKSTINPYLSEIKLAESQLKKSEHVNYKFPGTTKVHTLREPDSTRMLSNKFFAPEQSHGSRSPKQKNCYSNLHLKKLKLKNKNAISSLNIKRKSNYLMKRTEASMKNIYLKVKQKILS